MKGEKLSLLQRCIKWREANIKEKQFILILSFLVGIFTAFAALILKFFIHQIQNFLTDNFNATEANKNLRYQGQSIFEKVQSHLLLEPYHNHNILFSLRALKVEISSPKSGLYFQ